MHETRPKYNSEMLQISSKNAFTFLYLTKVQKTGFVLFQSLNATIWK